MREVLQRYFNEEMSVHIEIVKRESKSIKKATYFSFMESAIMRGVGIIIWNIFLL